VGSSFPGRYARSGHSPRHFSGRHEAAFLAQNLQGRVLEHASACEGEKENVTVSASGSGGNATVGGARCGQNREIRRSDGLIEMSDATRVRFRVRTRDVARSTGPMRTASKILSFTRECGDACAEVDRHLGRDTHLLWAAAAAAAACPSRSTWPLAYLTSRAGFRALVMRARTSGATRRLSPVYGSSKPRGSVRYQRRKMR